MDVEFSLYVNDFHCRLNDSKGGTKRMWDVEKRDQIKDLLDRGSVVLKEVAIKRGLPLADDKEERLILRSDHSRHSQRGRWRR